MYEERYGPREIIYSKDYVLIKHKWGEDREEEIIKGMKHFPLYRIGEKENADLTASAVFNFQNDFSKIVKSMIKGDKESGVNYHKTFLMNLLEKARIDFDLKYNHSIFDKILEKMLKDDMYMRESDLNRYKGFWNLFTSLKCTFKMDSTNSLDD